MPKENVYYWPLWFSQLLDPDEQRKIKKILPKLQCAQISLWRALNIYDDFFDGDGERSQLPQANTYYRRFLETHYRLNLSSSYYQQMQQLFKNLDRANTEEITGRNRCKNELAILTDKSFVLALGAIALLAKLGYKRSDKKSLACFNFFKYSLALKQLADDSLDWLEDFKRGLITLANKPVINAIKKKRLVFNLEKEPEIANLLFCQYASPLIISRMKNLCVLARSELAAFGPSEKNSLIKNLIRPHEIACRNAEKFRALVVEN